MKTNDLERWQCERFAMMPEGARKTCISHLRDSLRPWSQVVEGWKEQMAKGEALGSDDLGFQFGAGEAIRRILRQVVTDDHLPMVPQPGGTLAQNWDDFYLGALHAFITEESNAVV